MSNLLNHKIEEIIHLYQTKSCSPVEVMEATLLQLERWEPHLNAFISVFADAALQAAKAAEAAYMSGERVAALTGVPVSVKDIVDTAGQRTTCGSRILRNHVASSDATVYKRITQADGIVFGKANLLEFAYGAVHPDYGQTNNPFDLARTSGGSSSGSAASVSAGIGFASVGTDTGGSIRIPASYCGVVGLKPTYEAVDAHGVFPLSWSLDHVGPIARNVSDAAYFFDVMTAVVPGTASSAVAQLQAPSQVKVVGVLPSSFLRYSQPAVKQAYDAAIRQLSALGITCVELSDGELAHWEKAEDILMRILLPEAAQVHRRWWDRAADYAETTYRQIADGRQALAVDYLAALAEQQEYKRTVDTWFATYDVILTPTVDFPAPLEDPVIGDVEMDEMRYTGVSNVSGHPALTLNCGYSDEGLPIGLQLVGRAHADATLFGFARLLEQALPHNRAPG